MRHHQKYFSVEDAGRQARAAVRRRHEHRRRSRRPDPPRQRARAARPLQRCALLLGCRSEARSSPTASRIWPTSPSRPSSASYLDKDRRAVVEALVEANSAATTPAPSAPRCSRNADLTTELVKEFTELQGVVGGLYARAQGEPEDVGTAIYDHYKPDSMEDSIPRTQPARSVASPTSSIRCAAASASA